MTGQVLIVYIVIINCTVSISTVDALGGEVMFSIDPMSRTPIYEQIIEQLEQFILKGLLKPGDQIPSVRSLSISLSINPNTIQKAYAEIDRRGITCSVPGKGSFVSDNALDIIKNMKREELGILRTVIKSLYEAGISKDEIMDCVNAIYGE